MINMANEFEKIFEKLARYDDPNVIFTNWLDYVIDQNLFTVHDRKLDFKDNEQEYYDMFVAWVNIQKEYLDSNPEQQWYDYLGLFYEDIIQSKYKAGSRGQFFTPMNVCQAMAKITFQEDIDYTGKLINDCAGGSGRLLLASKQFAPNGIFILADLDIVACKMATLNFYIHGIRGAVICKNTLDLTFYEAYRINNYLGYGLEVPHIELCNSEREACNLFGVHNTDDSVIEVDSKSVPAEAIFNSDDVEEIELNYSSEKGASGKITYKNGQTTLM